MGDSVCMVRNQVDASNCHVAHSAPTCQPNRPLFAAAPWFTIAALPTPIHPMNLSTLALLILVPLLVWRIYSRLKTAMARQRSIVARHWTGVGVFLAMVLVPATELVDKPGLLAWLAAGTAG